MTFHYAGFTSHQAVARTAGNVLLRLADSLLLPFNCSDYAESLEQYLSQAVTAFEEKLAAKGISIGELTRFSRLLWMREMLIIISEFCQPKCLYKVREMEVLKCQSGNENKHFFISQNPWRRLCSYSVTQPPNWTVWSGIQILQKKRKLLL